VPDLSAEDRKAISFLSGTQAPRQSVCRQVYPAGNVHRFRLDRAASLFIFYPLRTWMRSATRGIPILMYHQVARGLGSRRVHPYYRTDTDPLVFEEQMSFLKRNGYRTVHLGEAIRLMQEPPADSEKRVVITFDDGFQDFYSDAFPILQKHGFSATVFLPTGFIGRQSRMFKSAPCLTWSEVRELSRAGIIFGSHTVTHPQLSQLPLAEVEKELRRSKDTIEQQLGRLVDSFAYPYAFPEADTAFRRQLRRILLEAGYQYGVSTTIGTATQASDPLLMRRLPVNSCDDPQLFRAKLEGGYDWLHTFQYASKLIGRVRG